MEDTYIYTVGHGGKKLSELIEELRKFGIDYLIDVRSKPYSKYYPQFNKENLVVSIKESGFVYSWWGDKIGGFPPAEWQCYTQDGKIDYDKMALNPIFSSTIDRLVEANNAHYKIALMCSESDPQMCHRSKLIGKMLLDRGIMVQHIVRNKIGKIVLLSQSSVFASLVNDNNDLFAPVLTVADLHLTSRKSYI